MKSIPTLTTTDEATSIHSGMLRSSDCCELVCALEQFFTYMNFVILTEYPYCVLKKWGWLQSAKTFLDCGYREYVACLMIANEVWCWRKWSTLKSIIATVQMMLLWLQKSVMIATFPFAFHGADWIFISPSFCNYRESLPMSISASVLVEINWKPSEF